MRSFFFLMCLPLLTAIPAFAEKQLPSEKFLDVARNPYGRHHWATMEGDIVHRRRDKDTEEAKVYIAIRFTPGRTIAQVIVDDVEGYYIGQKYENSEDATSVIPMEGNKKDTSKLASFGLRPQDLTMTFMFWNFVKELKAENIRGRHCRVFLLESPDKKEKVKVYISAEYFFPLKVEWLKEENEKPYRTGEFVSFRKQGNFWLVSTLVIYGPGWKTKLEFDKTRAEYTEKLLPADLFRKLKK